MTNPTKDDYSKLADELSQALGDGNSAAVDYKLYSNRWEIVAALRLAAQAQETTSIGNFDPVKFYREFPSGGYDWLRRCLTAMCSTYAAQAQEWKKDAERFQLCMRLGFPVRNQIATPHKMWTINGLWFGDTPTECLDAALAAEEKNP